MITISRNRSLARRLLLAAALAAGFGTLWSVLVVWLGTSALEAWSGGARPVRERLVITTDGTPLIESFAPDNLSLATYRDRDGRRRDGVDRTDRAPALSLSGEHEAVGSSPSRPGWPRRIRVFADEREPAAAWYFVHDGRPEGRGYFVGYERTSNRLIGHIGLAGFRDRPLPPDERIPVRGALATDFAPWSSAPLSIHTGGLWTVLRPDPRDVPPRLVHVPSGNLLRLADLAARTVTTVFKAPAPIASVGVPTLSSYSGGDPAKEQPILVRAAQTIYKLDHKYNLTGTFTLPAEIDRQRPLDWYEVDGGRAVVVSVDRPKIEEALRGVRRQTVYLVAEDGTIRDSFELALRNQSTLVSEEASLSLMALALPAPAALLAVEALVAAETPMRDDAGGVGALLKRAWPSLAAVLALSAALAAAAWRRGRAFGLSRRAQAAWAAFVLLFGVPAYAGFLLHRRWPVREPCPHCHARSARDRDTCAGCGTPFPAPAPRGTEIFA